MVELPVPFLQTHARVRVGWAHLCPVSPSLHLGSKAWSIDIYPASILCNFFLAEGEGLEPPTAAMPLLVFGLAAATSRLPGALPVELQPREWNRGESNPDPSPKRSGAAGIELDNPSSISSSWSR